ncbi:DUF6894 family protein [Aureimonas glaciei]|uniref:DUF6894 domain-containing protein n=1 Tax=Aureimonas glaciei TaxID=1776957 RepID=A0A917DDC9_9HYPH|nr:hypothetical protein [Aureimonas glaciei]GGD28786.1 hypothetical protein GCM10011335_34930 [Aureimonas glaciei]
MARYFFHVMNGKADIDEDGIECADLDAVREEAIRSAGQMLSTGRQSWNGEAWRMTVCDEERTVVFSVNFSVDRHGL